MTNINKSQLDEAIKSLEKKLMEKISSLTTRVTTLEELNKKLTAENSDLSNKVEELKDKLANAGDGSENTVNVRTWADIVEKNIRKPREQLIVVNAAINEQKDRERRRNNVMVFGLLEADASLTIDEKNKKIEKELRIS